MTRLILLTGFLGSGKTTLLKRLLPGAGGASLGVIVNEFGAVGVDGRELSALRATLREIVGGSVFCSCRMDQFEAALEGMTAADAPDILFVEASGLSDPTGIRALLSRGAWAERIEYAGCICVADAARLAKVYQTARVCRRQLSVADVVLLNRCDLATPEQLSAALAVVRAQRPDAPCVQATFGRADEDILALLGDARRAEAAGDIHTADLSLHTLTLRVAPGLTALQLERLLATFAEDTYRIKGYVSLADGAYLVDCVGAYVSLLPREGQAQCDNRIAVLYGYGLPARKSIRSAMAWMPGAMDIVV